MGVLSFCRGPRNWVVSRFCRYLVVLVSLAAYFLANTNASLALDYWLRSQAATKADVATSTEETPAETHKKCKHCCKPGETEGFSPSPSTSQDCDDTDCDRSSCPCCPDDANKHRCPCPGGCALCSVAKAPCLTPINLNLHDTSCVDDCASPDSPEYPSLKSGGLDRPPRV